MISDLEIDFTASQSCASAWTDHIWRRRAEEEPAMNRVRAEAFERRKALRCESDEPGNMRAQPAPARQKRAPVTASEVRRVLRTVG